MPLMTSPALIETAGRIAVGIMGDQPVMIAVGVARVPDHLYANSAAPIHFDAEVEAERAVANYIAAGPTTPAAAAHHAELMRSAAEQANKDEDDDTDVRATKRRKLGLAA